MAKTKKPDRIAYSKVCLIDKTYHGRVLYVAELDADTRTRIYGYYPAEGPDPVKFDISIVSGCLNTVASLRRWIATHFNDVEPAVAAARARRYVLRSENLNDGGR